VADPTSRDLYLSLGAAIESACLRALADGSPLTFEPAPPAAPPAPLGPTSPTGQGERVVGWLRPGVTAATPDPADLELAAVLDRRQTARGPHLPRAVPTDLQQALVAEAARHGCVLQIVTNRPMVRRLAKLAGQATALLFADQSVHAELWHWLRLDPSDPAYQRDGLTAACLELDGLPLWLARQLMPPARMRWLSRTGLQYVLAADTAKTARRSAAICLLSAPSMDPAALVETGRVLQRLWLRAAAAGLTTHPLSALLDCPETAGQTTSLFAVEETSPTRRGGSPEVATDLPSPARRGAGGEVSPFFPAAVFRLGYAAPAARSPRLPLAELWHDARTAQG
jgi:hypothetical protein